MLILVQICACVSGALCLHKVISAKVILTWFAMMQHLLNFQTSVLKFKFDLHTFGEFYKRSSNLEELCGYLLSHYGLVSCAIKYHKCSNKINCSIYCTWNQSCNKINAVTILQAVAGLLQHALFHTFTNRFKLIFGDAYKEIGLFYALVYRRSFVSCVVCVCCWQFVHVSSTNAVIRMQ